MKRVFKFDVQVNYIPINVMWFVHRSAHHTRLQNNLDEEATILQHSFEDSYTNLSSHTHIEALPQMSSDWYTLLRLLTCILCCNFPHKALRDSVEQRKRHRGRKTDPEKAMIDFLKSELYGGGGGSWILVGGVPPRAAKRGLGNRPRRTWA